MARYSGASDNRISAMTGHYADSNRQAIRAMSRKLASAVMGNNQTPQPFGNIAMNMGGVVQQKTGPLPGLGGRTPQQPPKLGGFLGKAQDFMNSLGNLGRGNPTVQGNPRPKGNI